MKCLESEDLENEDPADIEHWENEDPPDIEDWKIKTRPKFISHSLQISQFFYRFHICNVILRSRLLNQLNTIDCHFSIKRLPQCIVLLGPELTGNSQYAQDHF